MNNFMNNLNFGSGMLKCEVEIQEEVLENICTFVREEAVKIR